MPQDPHRATCAVRTAATFVRIACALASGWFIAQPTRGDALEKIARSHRLVYAADMEGGGPFVYPDPQKRDSLTGFEVEIINLLARDLGAEAEFSQGQWDTLLELLESRRVDIVMNGYEWTKSRSARYLASRPYYLYRLQLMARKDGGILSWESIETGSRPLKVAVLRGSVAEPYARAHAGKRTEIVGFDGAVDAMEAVRNGQADATLQDLPAAVFYKDRYPELALAGEPVGKGYYVIYMRKDEQKLKSAIDKAIAARLEDGSIRRICERYGIWNAAQEDLAGAVPEDPPGDDFSALGGWTATYLKAPVLLKGALLTVALSFGSMPIAIVLGLLIALGRLYGPLLVRVVLRAYVEVIRGTPLMLQLYVLYFLLPRFGVSLDAWAAGVAGLAINYSAYEAEIYRAGLQAIPIGQLEAALALGMSRPMAITRVIVPQAVRIVIPPVTNDFIALFKDTSVCSAITLVELTKRYYIEANSTGYFVELGIVAAVLYMIMSLPLSWLSHWFEKRLAGAGGAEQARGALR